MNIYDTKSIYCSKCGKFIGEIDYDAVVILPKCGKCADPTPEGDDKMSYLKSRYSNQQSENILVH
jgi:hypothetical protein